MEERQSAPARVLTNREAEVLELLSAGLTGEEIAARLVLSPETIRTHVRNAMAKLQARTRTHAVVMALDRREIRLRAASADQPEGGLEPDSEVEAEHSQGHAQR